MAKTIEDPKVEIIKKEISRLLSACAYTGLGPSGKLKIFIKFLTKFIKKKDR